MGLGNEPGLIDKIPSIMLQAYGILGKKGLGRRIDLKGESWGAAGIELFGSFRGPEAGKGPLEEIPVFWWELIAKFKVPRYMEYRKSSPRTPAESVEKHKLMAREEDFRSGCCDTRKNGGWLDPGQG